MSAFYPVQQYDSANIDWFHACRRKHAFGRCRFFAKSRLSGPRAGQQAKFEPQLEEDSEDPDKIYLRREVFPHLPQHIVLFVPFCLWPSCVFSQKCHSAFMGTRYFYMFFLANIYFTFMFTLVWLDWTLTLATELTVYPLLKHFSYYIEIANIYMSVFRNCKTLTVRDWVLFILSL